MIEIETLDGDNKYKPSEELGPQDSKKNLLFDYFPPILNLQLCRFSYDVERDAMGKINDRFEYYNEINLSKYLTEDSELKDKDTTYILHAVLVHQGDTGIIIHLKNRWRPLLLIKFNVFNRKGIYQKG
jgi:ubiquitin carboxyl-terminal hydrolase 7